MPNFLGLAALAGTLASLTPAIVNAQDRSPVSFDANIGWGTSRTHGSFVGNRNGHTGDVLLALRLQPALGGSLVIAVSASMQAADGSNTCLAFPPNPDCVPEFPDFMLIAALPGIENDAGTLRLLAGAAYVDMLHETAAAAGIVARVDAALPIWGPLALAVSLRGAAVPEIDGEAFQLYALGFGFRVR